MSRQEEKAGILSWRDFIFREKYRGVFFFLSLLYCEIFITIHVHSSGWSCTLFFPLTLVLIEVKKPFHSSSAAVCFPPFRYYLVCRGGSDVYFSNILRSLCLLFCVLSKSSLLLLLTHRVRDSFDGTLCNVLKPFKTLTTTNYILLYWFWVLSR